MVDPYFEQMTVGHKIKKQLIALWPSVYKATNFLITTLFSTLINMIKSALRSLRPY